MGPVARISFYYCSTKVFIKTVETVKAAVFPVFTSNYCTEFIQSFVARTRLTRFVAETEKWTTVERYSLVEHGCCYYRGVQYQPSQRKHRDPNLVSPTLEARYISMIGDLAVSLNVHIRFSLTHIPALTQRLSSLPSSLSLSLSLSYLHSISFLVNRIWCLSWLPFRLCLFLAFPRSWILLQLFPMPKTTTPVW